MILLTVRYEIFVDIDIYLEAELKQSVENLIKHEKMTFLRSKVKGPSLQKITSLKLMLCYVM